MSQPIPTSPTALSQLLLDHLAGQYGKDIMQRFRRSTNEELMPLALAGDDPVDAYLDNSDVNPKTDDILAKLKEDVGRGHVQAVALWEHLNTVPEWVDMARVRRGQNVYFSFVEVFNLLFLYDSLVGTGSPDFSKILLATGYMSNPNRQTFRRLAETAHWVVNCMTDDALGPGSDAWQATVRVRFLHASVRRRLQAKWVSNAEVILPINQLQNCATLLAICVQPFMQFPSLGLSCSNEEREDFAHAWRYIGFFIGIPEKWNPLRNGLEYAVSYSMDLTRFLIKPDASTIRLSNTVLRGAAIGLSDMQEKRRSAWIVSKKPEAVTARFERHYKSNFLTLTQVARILIGDQFCDFVGYPKRKEIPLYNRVLGRVSLFLVLFFTRFLRLSSWLLALSIRFRKTFYLNRYNEILGERPKFLLKHDPTTDANGKAEE